MIVKTERMIAITCPACQEIQEHEFSLFALSNHPFQLLCHCGFSQGHLFKRNKFYELDMLGLEGNRVRKSFATNDFVSKPLINILAGFNTRSLGYLGTSEAVQEAVLAESFGVPVESGNYFNPEIMRQILDLLQGLAQQDKICCECENSSIGIDVYSERVELVCSFCGSMVQIGASTKEHYERLEQVREIRMKACTSQFLEGWLKPLI